MVEEPKHGFRARDFSGVTSALDEHRRFVGVFAGLFVGQGNLPNITTFEGFADRIELENLSVLFGPLFQERVGFVIGVVVLEIELALLEWLYLCVVSLLEEALSIPRAGDAMKGRPLRFIFGFLLFAWPIGRRLVPDRRR